LQIAVGAISIILSVIVIVYPIFGSYTTIFFISSTLVIVGVERIASGLSAPRLKKSTRLISVGIGIAIVLFAVMGFATPELTTKYFVILLALGLLANGVVRIITGIKRTEQDTLARTMVIGAGIVSIALAILVLAFPGFGRGLLLLMIAIALLINGIQIIIIGIRGKRAG
jgi:uncharacterized membrane protein HdeD (DUF308 family)